MRQGTLDVVGNFIVIEPLVYQVGSVTVPYIFGIGDSTKDFRYVRTYTELVNYINKLLYDKVKTYIYTYDLTRLATMLSNTFELKNVMEIRESVKKFNIFGLKFRGISELTCDAKISDFCGAELKNTKHLPDVSLKSQGYNWISNYLEKLLTSEVEFLDKIFSLNPNDPPLTRAGYTKRLLAESCHGGQYQNLREQNRTINPNAFSKYNDYNNKYFGFKSKYNCIISKSHFEFMRDVSRGGCVAYNTKYLRKLVNNVCHYDITSSYIAQMFKNKFPMRRIGTYQNVDNIWSLTNGGEYWAMIQVYCYGVKSCSSFKPLIVETERNKPNPFVTVIGDREIDDAKFIVSAEAVQINCTFDEFRYFMHFYDFDDFEVTFADVYECDYLPSEYLSVIMNMFYSKSDAKLSNAPEWLIAFIKAGLNSSWGFCWSGFYGDLESDIAKYNLFGQGFEDRTWSYMWGVAVTAYAREALYKAIILCGKKWLYSDTDSVFFLYDESIIEKLDGLNYQIQMEMLESKNSELFDFEYGKYSLGYWDREQDLTHFYIYGSKQYIGYGDEGFDFAFSSLCNFKPDEWFRSLNCTIDEFFEKYIYLYARVPIEYGYVSRPTKHEAGVINIDGKDYSYPSGVFVNKTTFKLGSEFNL